ncbi:MAG: L,D-transpeptidase [Firmicutes bacterium]|nr:L,D-transpeptidase [Bacillota bacterium]
MNQLTHKAVHSVLLLLIILLTCLPYSRLSGSQKLGRQVYAWQFLDGKLQVSSYPAAPSRGKYIIIDKSTNTLYFYNDGHLLKRYPVATGKDPAFTPEGKFAIAQKAILIPNGKTPPLRPRAYNPQLGSRWLGLDVSPQADKREPEFDSRAPKGQKYGIHGTDDPASIGRYVSGGCVRMYNQDVNELYEQVELGTVVEIRP